MNENILHLGYLTLRLNSVENRMKEGEFEIRERIYLLHSAGEINLDIKEPKNQTYNKQGRLNNASNQNIKKKDELPNWAKKIEREISKKTHPDKLLGRPEEEISEKTKLFLDAKSKFKDRKFADLIPIALQLGINFSNYQEEFQQDVLNRIRQIQIEIREIEKKVSFQWHDYNESQKIEAIDIILKEAGIKRTKEEIKKVVNKRIKRRTGTRPKSIRETRGLK